MGSIRDSAGYVMGPNKRRKHFPPRGDRTERSFATSRTLIRTPGAKRCQPGLMAKPRHAAPHARPKPLLRVRRS